MPRPRKVVRPASFHCNVPEDLKARLDLHLFSPLENRVPYGAYSEFLAEAIRDKFEARQIDLGDYTELPKGTIIKGPTRTIELILAFLTQ